MDSGRREETKLKAARARIRGLLALLRCDSNENDVMLGWLSEKRAVDGEVFDISTRNTRKSEK